MTAQQTVREINARRGYTYLIVAGDKVRVVSARVRGGALQVRKLSDGRWVSASPADVVVEA